MFHCICTLYLSLSLLLSPTLLSAHTNKTLTVEIYVDQNTRLTKEQQNGSKLAPFSTIQRAVQSISDYSKKNQPKIVFYIASGWYKEYIRVDQTVCTLTFIPEGTVIIGGAASPTKCTICFSWNITRKNHLKKYTPSIAFETGKTPESHWKFQGKIEVNNTAKRTAHFLLSGEIIGHLECSAAPVQLILKNAHVHSGIRKPAQFDLISAKDSIFDEKVCVRSAKNISNCIFNGGIITPKK